MPAPVINPTTSVLGFASNTYAAYQPLSSDLTLYAALAAAGGTITATGSAFVNGAAVSFSAITGGAGLAAGTIYYIVAAAGATFKLAATVGGAAVAFTSGITAATISAQTWSCPNLPPGLGINAATGLISGVPSLAGVYNCQLSVTDANGTGILAITIGIDDSGFADEASIEVNLDLVTGAVTFPTASDGQLHGKLGDYLPLLISTQKQGISLDLPVAAVEIGIKEFETDNLLVLSDGNFTKVGAYNTTCWRTLLYLDPALLTGALSDYQSNAMMGGGTPPAGTDPSQLVTILNMPMEIRLQIVQTDTNLTPALMDRSSQTFPLALEMNLAPAL